MQFAAGDLTFDLATAGEPGKPLVLMLHGFPQTSHSWRYQLEPLADTGFFAVAPNQRGYSPGARPAGIEAYATANLLDDALTMIDELGGGRAHVVGHDWGGQLSWLLAAHHPERVVSLTVLSRPHPQAFLRSMKEDKAQSERSKHHRAFQNPDSAKLLLEDDARRLRGLFGGQFVPAADQDAYLSVLGEEAALDAAINWYRAPVLAGGDQPLAPAATPNIQVPTLFIWGDADATVGRLAAEATADYIDGSYKFVELAGVGHFVTDQAGERVTELLLEHIRSHHA